MRIAIFWFGMMAAFGTVFADGATKYQCEVSVNGGQPRIVVVRVTSDETDQLAEAARLAEKLYTSEEPGLKVNVTGCKER
jgi:hypothetical protein